MLNLAEIRERAMTIRDIGRSREERSLAALSASDDLLALCREVELLRASMTSDATEVARVRRLIRLAPVELGPLDELALELSGIIFTFAKKHRATRKQPATWDMFSLTTAIKVLGKVDAFIQKRLAEEKEP